MTDNPLLSRRGATIDLGPCVVGENLNLLALRGFAGLDQLADISSPDIYDMKDNPKGTQRDLKVKHAAECFEYAMESQNEPPETSPRAFPEILLNARDIMWSRSMTSTTPARFLEVTSMTDVSEITQRVVGVRIRVTDLEFPKRTPVLR
jgi:hypothetical protein